MYDDIPHDTGIVPSVRRRSTTDDSANNGRADDSDTRSADKRMYGGIVWI